MYNAQAVKVSVLENRAIRKRALVYRLTALGKCNTLQPTAIVEGILVDSLYTFGDNDGGYGIVTERLLLFIYIIETVLILLYLFLVVEIVVTERESSYGHNTLVIGNNDVSALTLIRNKSTVLDYKLALDRYRATSRKQGYSAVDLYLKGYSRNALALGSNYAVLINGGNLRVAG